MTDNIFDNSDSRTTISYDPTYEYCAKIDVDEPANTLVIMST